MPDARPRFTVHPLTPERWPDFEALFGKNGACGGCWCMWWRLTASAFQANKGDANRRAMKRRVTTGGPPGLIAYHGDEPVAWCAVEPRPAYPRFERSRILAPVDDEPVWSVTCFFVSRPWRRKGLTVRLLDAAVEHVRRHGGRIVEGYPKETRKDEPGPFVWTGTAEAFRRAGFVEVARRSKDRPIMRRSVRAAGRSRRGAAPGRG
jgi:GNAT superfamily N-acetyltransferase